VRIAAISVALSFLASLTDRLDFTFSLIDSRPSKLAHEVLYLLPLNINLGPNLRGGICNSVTSSKTERRISGVNESAVCELAIVIDDAVLKGELAASDPQQHFRTIRTVGLFYCVSSLISSAIDTKVLPLK
jgi:hypothetical protein